MLDQRRRRWADVVQMLYQCIVFAWLDRHQNANVCLVLSATSLIDTTQYPGKIEVKKIILVSWQYFLHAN